MIPWIKRDTAKIPGQGGSIHLYQRDNEFSVRLDNCELMNSRQHGSEDALAEITCTRIREKSKPRVLIGGLGMGFTLAAALKNLAAEASVLVAELIPSVILWNQGPLAHLAGAPLEDHRVILCKGDVGEIIKNEQRGFGVRCFVGAEDGAVVSVSEEIDVFDRW